MNTIMTKKPIYKLRLIAYFVVLLFIDQYTKFWARTELINKNFISVINNILQFTYVENDGAVWGIMSGKKLFLTVLPFFMIAVLIIVIIRVPDTRHYFPILILMTFITTGAVGNLIDRLRFGYVIDFIYFKPIDFPVFNVADMYITVSVFVLVFLSFILYRKDDMDFLSFKKKKTSLKTVEEPQNDNEVSGGL